MTTRIQGITLFHLKQAFLDAMISFQHSESLIVSDNLYRPDIADATNGYYPHDPAPYDLPRDNPKNVRPRHPLLFQENIRVTNIDRIDQYGFLVYDQVRVIGNAVWQRPHILEEGL